jgi:hypothetical protein
VTDDGLARIPNIRYLGLASNTRIFGRGLKHLTNLASLSLFSNNQITAKHFSPMQMENLTELSIGVCSSSSSSALFSILLHYYFAD